MRKFLLMLGEPSDPTLCDAGELAEAADGDELILDFVDHAEVGETTVVGGGAIAESVIARIADDYERS